VAGCERVAPDLDVAAVIAKRVGGDVHARWVADAIRASCQAVPVGAIPRDETLTLPERHLGLVTAAEGPLTEDFRTRLADVVERHIDLSTLLTLASPLRARALPAQSGPGGGIVGGSRRGPLRVGEAPLRVAIARDVAFQFYYRENLAMLEAAGAELVFWSPLRDAAPDADGFYFGGGYPELHARCLAENRDALKALRERALGGTPIYAECGGLMYLADALEDLDGVAHPMVGLLPVTVRMRPRRLTLGYREVRFTADTPLGLAGTRARGHEFHYSTLDAVPERVPRVWHDGDRAEAYLIHRALLSYVHLHFASNPELPRAFVAACADAR
jgi:cobyrinic acid a,c-diamide synthase